MAFSVFRHLGGRWLASRVVPKTTASSPVVSVCSYSTRVLPTMARGATKGPLYAATRRPMGAGATVLSRSFHLTGSSLDKNAVDEELVQFLGEEIGAETKAQKRADLPTLEGFKIKTEGSKVTLVKMSGNETITVKLNVNHTVDATMPSTENADPAKDQVDLGQMESKPAFTVEIEKGGNILAFACSYSTYEDENPGEDPDVIDDSFHVDEVVFHQGDWKENTYSVSGQIIDGYLYDLMMAFLEERGIDSAFTAKLSEFCTTYEHKMYINLLENIRAFVKGETPKIMGQASRNQ